MPPRRPKTLWTKRGGLMRPRSTKVREGVEVADVVALDLEAGAVLAQVVRMYSISAKVLRKIRSRSPRDRASPNRA
jgi:hypothetical protein